MTCARDIGSEEIIRILKSPDAARAYAENGVLAAYLYGSAAHGRMHAHSDVDVAVVFEHSVPASEQFDRRLALISGLSDLLHSDDVDVVPLNDAPLLLAFEALRQPVRLYRPNDREAAEFELKAIGMYYDFKSILDEYITEMRKRIKERGLA